MLYLALNSGYASLLGKPARQMAIPASTPLHVYWCITKPGSTPPGCLWVLGTTQRMKWGSVLYRVVIRSSSWPLKKEDTVLPPPFFFLSWSLGASIGWPGWSAKQAIARELDPFLIISTMVSLRGSLFFSSHPVKL